MTQTLYASPEVSRLMATDVVSVSPEYTVMQAALTMTAGRVGVAVVVEDERVIGMVSERDLMSKVVAQGLDPGEVLVEHVMSAPVIGIQETATLADAVRRMVDFRYRRLPVVRGEKLVGVISQTDLLRHYPTLVAAALSH